MKTLKYLLILLIPITGFASASACYSTLKLSVVADEMRTRDALLKLLRDLNNGVKNQKMETLAPYARFPLTVTGRGSNLQLRNRKQLLTYFDESFKDGMFHKEESCVYVRVSYKGIMFGKTGEIWLNVAVEKGAEVIFIQTIHFPIKKTPRDN
jgi:hypothetical protein